MATETSTTTEREDAAPAGANNVVSDERGLGRLEGQVSILLRNVEEQRRQAREDYHALSVRIDRHFYWMLGLCVAIIITVVGSAIGLAIRLGG